MNPRIAAQNELHRFANMEWDCALPHASLGRWLSPFYEARSTDRDGFVTLQVCSSSEFAADDALLACMSPASASVVPNFARAMVEILV